MPLPWKNVRKALKRKGIEVTYRGSEGRIKGTGPDGVTRIHILQHKCCSGPTADVWDVHVKAIMRKFGLTRHDFER